MPSLHGTILFLSTWSVTLLQFASFFSHVKPIGIITSFFMFKILSFNIFSNCFLKKKIFPQTFYGTGAGVHEPSSTTG